ncbi:MAG: hypothetical protein GY710_01535 [Desulfobacteraceae bacterium]|nr:hypothetical protein [Desulfobacteraceae bacterium]
MTEFPMGMVRFFKILSALISVLVLGSCANHVAYNTLSQYLETGNCDRAVQLVEESRKDYGTNSKLLFLLDSAMVNMQCQNFKTAQKRFQEAQDLAQQLWTMSLSRETASLVANDYMLSYQGEDYERAMIHLMSTIAYLDANNLEDALVECRRLDSLLTLYNDRYDEKNVYKDDAFGRYLSGILNEADHNLDAAFIDYQKAMKTYADYEKFYHTPVPPSLKEDFLRVAKAVDRMKDARILVPEHLTAGTVSQKNTQTLGKIIFIQLAGKAPVKREEKISIPTRMGPVTLAFPKFAPFSWAPKSTQFILKSETDQRIIRAPLVEDINAIALKNLADHRARIITKTIARAIAKQVAIQQVAKNDDKNVEQAIKLTLNLLNLFLERADLRSWRTLPAAIYMTRVFVKPGVWQMDIPARGNEKRKTKKILVKAGKINYIIVNDSPGL